MKMTKALLISTIVLLLVLSSGCLHMKWSYDFTSATATIDDWYFYLSALGDYRLDEAGLCLDDAYITTPVYFNGEVSVKVVFELDVSELSTAFIEIGISDGVLWSGNNETWVGLWGIGNEMEEGWKSGDYGWESRRTMITTSPSRTLIAMVATRLNSKGSVTRYCFT